MPKFPPSIAAEVYRLDLWMGSYRSKTPKRSSLWSNREVVGLFFSAVRGNVARKDRNFKPTEQYLDSAGRKRFKGTKDVTKTGFLGWS